MLTALRDAVSAFVAPVEVVLVDNNPPEMPRDPEIYRHADFATIVRSNARTIGAVRNAGVTSVRGEVDFLVFLDSDVVVSTDFFANLVAAFATSSVPTVVGCKVVAPADGHWTELAADLIHREAGDGPRRHLNSGCLAIKADAFHKLGGFSTVLPANEDYDLCDRVHEMGGSVWQFESLQSVHLGNPKSIRGVFRRLRWHGRGAFNSGGRLVMSPMVILVIANTASALVSFCFAVWAVKSGEIAHALVALLLGLSAAPVCFWALRSVQFRRWINPMATIPLLSITLFARQFGMFDQVRAQRRTV